MATNNVEELIVEYLKNNSDIFHPSQIKPIVYTIYGAEKINDNNILGLEREIYNILCELEKREIVKNTNRLPPNAQHAVAGSRWILLKDK
jgi:hypothetical protein